MQVVIPMAGLGQRFREAGYATPKPLIPVAGIPMVVRVIRDLPPASRIICIVHPQHIAEYAIDRRLRDEVPGCEVVVAPGTTAGQACSVALAGPRLNLHESVCVAACDNTHRFESDRLARATANAPDCLVWTYRGYPRVVENPHWYGWVRVDDERVREVSVKCPISALPLNDHVVSGTFWFRSAELLMQAIADLIASGKRVNGEFYLDAVADLLARRGSDVRVFEVDEYIGWGTPGDLEAFQRSILSAHPRESAA